MLAGTPRNDELEATRVRLDDQTEIPGAPSGRAHAIRIDPTHRLSAETGSFNRQGVRGGLILVALATSFGLAVVGALSGYRFFNPNTAASPIPAQSPNSSAGIPNSIKGDRLPILRTITHETDRGAPAKLPDSPNLLASTTIAYWKPSPVAVPPAPSASNRATAAQPRATATAPSPAKPLTPVAETRPTTIDGWTLREVVDGTAVLEGPGGTLRVRRGDTVPGVGSVVAIFRWGNRPIVATSRGLIATP